ncbi:hypothetical protein JTE90_014614 [Oedothorax gibbosus]|uniref:Uncharacterized protein n=1 Tax=Oedothorax gibbosus TaxID=931172 RepID=A0AAV6VA56_9ARAC|nr:hypothetical protein JTE90_014614 [Oedothorax gibbosus]
MTRISTSSPAHMNGTDAVHEAALPMTNGKTNVSRGDEIKLVNMLEHQAFILQNLLLVKYHKRQMVSWSPSSTLESENGIFGYPVEVALPCG